MWECITTNKKKIFWIVLLIVFLLIFFGCVTFYGINHYKTYMAKSANPDKTSSSVNEEIQDDGKIIVETPMDFDELEKVNPDIYAWIKVDGTVVDYPVLQSATEKSYYLSHNVDKKKSSYGAIYTQYYNSKDFEDYNTVVYGHNMLNGTMFGTLKRFRDKKFFEKNKNITVYMRGRILKYEIFAAYVFDDRHILMSFDFDDEKDRQLYLDTIHEFKSISSFFREGTEVNSKDKLITLSTCTSKDNERYIVQGVLVYDSQNPED